MFFRGFNFISQSKHSVSRQFQASRISSHERDARSRTGRLRSECERLERRQPACKCHRRLGASRSPDAIGDDRPAASTPPRHSCRVECFPFRSHVVAFTQPTPSQSDFWSGTTSIYVLSSVFRFRSGVRSAPPESSGSSLRETQCDGVCRLTLHHQAELKCKNFGFVLIFHVGFCGRATVYQPPGSCARCALDWRLNAR